MANDFIGKVSLDFSGVTDAPPSKYIEEDGTYLFKVVGVKKEEGDSEYPKIVFRTEVVAPAQYKGKLLDEKCSLSPKALFRLRNMLMAILGKEIPKSAVSIDFSKLADRRFTGEVAMKPGQKDPTKTYANLVAVFPASKFASMGASTPVTDDEEEDLSSLDATAPSGGGGTLEEAELL